MRKFSPAADGIIDREQSCASPLAAGQGSDGCDSFTARVYAAAARIPYGHVASYGQLAAVAGNPRAARQAGRAMSACADADIPCHRVVHKDGSLCRFWPEQRELLLAEGVAVSAAGCVDMRKFAWRHWQEDDGV